ncbi:SEC-C metal-binding domain-containing protein, partial [Novipirellula sp.]|uniref:SEC-C metal-binding domain-containing protein n=1 Tax=Novipirellula sp. TaxID=2795430 RepID=UPI0035630590
PVFLDLKHESYAKVSECFPNVREKMKRDGGTLQHGWCVWLAPKMLIEGEFHAVWCSPNGEFVDITPKPDGEQRVLFIPDNKTKYQNVHVDNVRVILNDSPELQAVLAANRKKMELLHQYNDGSGQSKIPLSAITQKFATGASYGGGTQNVRRNDPCPCNSGKKYKACCMRR